MAKAKRPALLVKFRSQAEYAKIRRAAKLTETNATQFILRNGVKAADAILDAERARQQESQAVPA